MYIVFEAIQKIEKGILIGCGKIGKYMIQKGKLRKKYTLFFAIKLSSLLKIVACVILM